MSPEEEATTTPPAEAEEPAAPAAIEETPTVEDTPANDAEEAPATADAGEDPEDGTAADREDVFAADDEATAELLAVGENLAGMTLADDLTGMTLTDEAPQPEPVKTPDVFDRMGYGSSEDGDGGERAAADVESDDDDRDLVAPLVDAIRRADSGEEPLSPSSIGAKAWALSYEISGFVATLDAPQGVDATIDELPPFIRDTVNALPTLARALALAPEPINTQRKIRIPAAGVHRVAVVEIIASLLEIGVADVDAAVAAANVVPGSLSLVPAVAAVLFTHTQGSPLLCVATRVVCLALQSPTEALWAPLLGDGWATAAADAGVTPAVGAEDVHALHALGAQGRDAAGARLRARHGALLVQPPPQGDGGQARLPRASAGGARAGRLSAAEARAITRALARAPAPAGSAPCPPWRRTCRPAPKP